MEGLKQASLVEEDIKESKPIKVVKLYKFILYLNLFILIYLFFSVSMLFIQYPSPDEFRFVLIKAGYLGIYIKMILATFTIDIVLILISKIHELMKKQ